MKCNIEQLKVGTKFMLTGEGWNQLFVGIPSIIIKVDLGKEQIQHYYLKDVLYRTNHILVPGGKIDTTSFYELEKHGFEIMNKKNTKPDWL